jgi:DNA adenine methylase
MLGLSLEETQILPALWSYPGAKSRAIEIIWPYLKNKKTVISPFLGGGSLEINLANRGIKVVGYDYFNLIAELWTWLLTDNKTLYDKVESIVKPLRGSSYTEFNIWWKKEWKDLPAKTDSLEKASLYYILQSSAHSVRLGSQSASSSRFEAMLKRNNIHKILEFNQPNLTFGGQVSFEDSILKHPDDYLYLDPPYLLDDKLNKLYGYNGEMHKGFNHVLLSDILHTRSDWIMSYNYCDEVAELYKDKKIIKVDWQYAMSKEKICNEILIFG